MLMIANGLKKFKLVFNQQLRKKKKRTNTNYVFSLTHFLPVQCVCCTRIGESKQHLVKLSNNWQVFALFSLNVSACSCHLGLLYLFHPAY